MRGFYRVVAAELLLLSCFLQVATFAQEQNLSLHDTMRLKDASITYSLRCKNQAGNLIFDNVIYTYSSADKNAHPISILNDEQSERHKGSVISLDIDRTNQRLYYSTIEHNTRNEPETDCWYYDIKTGKERLLREGKIESVDANGVINVLINASDHNGRYTQIIKYSPELKYLTSSEKTYTGLLK